MQQQQVLVTGGSGYLAGWVIVSLLQQGHRVRTTVRNLQREEEVRAAVATQVDAGDRLSFVVADLLSDLGWVEAAAGMDAIQHVASPMGVGGTGEDDLIRPAREGTQRVLDAAAKAGVKRVVLTSSLLAALPSDAKKMALDEATWTNLNGPDINQYTQSKTLAERDAWTWSQKNPGTQLTTILPGMIQGPVLSKTSSASLELVSRMLTGQIPALPRLGFSIADARDVADLHVKAMVAPVAAGHRFAASSDFLWMADIARILRDNLGANAAKVPVRKIPDFAVKAAALFNPEVKLMVPNLGKQRTCSALKAQRLLGWTPRPATESIIDCGKSLVAMGLN